MVTISSIIKTIITIGISAVVLSVIYILFGDDYGETKQCLHSCKICKYKDICDYYQNKKNL